MSSAGDSKSGSPYRHSICLNVALRGCASWTNSQFWYPNENSQQRIYTNASPHGVVLSDVKVGQPKAGFLSQIFREVEVTLYFKELSAVRSGLWPLIAIACRHYRLPVPLNFFPRPEQPPPASPLPVYNRQGRL